MDKFQWDDETTANLAKPGTPDWVETHLITGIRLRASIKEREKENEEMKAQANELLAAAMGFASLKKVVATGIGRVIQKEGSNVSYPKNKISDSLLAQGVEAAVIGKALEDAKTIRTYTSFEFTAVK